MKRKQADSVADLVKSFTKDGPKCAGVIWNYLTEQKGMSCKDADDVIAQLKRWSSEKITCHLPTQRPAEKKMKKKEEVETTDNETEEDENDLVFDQKRLYSYAGIFYDSRQAQEAVKDRHVFQDLLGGKIGIIVIFDPLLMNWGENDGYRATMITHWLGDHILNNPLYKWRLKLNKNNHTAIAASRGTREEQLRKAREEYQDKIELYNQRKQLFQVKIRKSWNEIRMDRKPVHSTSRATYSLLVLEFVEREE